jgi:hypothetical protein
MNLSIVTPSVSVTTPPPRGRRTTVRRAPSAGARYRSSTRSIDIGYLATIHRWDEERARREFARLRWGSHTFMPCPHCGTIDEHGWSQAREDWRCLNCRKYFDVTTNTLLEGAKRSFLPMYVETFLWSCGSSGIPALTLREMVGTASYNTTFSLISRLREGLVRGQNTGLIAGVVEMDGAHASGKDSAGRRGRPLAQQRPKTVEDEAAKAQSIVDAFNAKQAKKRQTPAERQALKAEEAELLRQGAVRDPNTGQLLPVTRRMVVTLRRRSGNPGDGSAWTKVGVGMAETPEVAEFLANRHVLIPESVLATDEGVAFKKLGREFRLHTTVNHSERLVGPEGQHVNLAESFTARQDRAEHGIYLNIESKYLHDYACETAFREDHRRVTPKDRTSKLLFWALNVGKSQYWTGYTAGKNRQFEHLVPHPRAVGSSSGPAKRQPGQEMDVRPPR